MTATAQQDVRDRQELARVAALARAARSAEDRVMASVNTARTSSVRRRAIPWDVLERATGESDLQPRHAAWIARKATA